MIYIPFFCNILWLGCDFHFSFIYSKFFMAILGGMSIFLIPTHVTELQFDEGWWGRALRLHLTTKWLIWWFFIIMVFCGIHKLSYYIKSIQKSSVLTQIWMNRLNMISPEKHSCKIQSINKRNLINTKVSNSKHSKHLTITLHNRN
jgi:hypothetical protein